MAMTVSQLLQNLGKVDRTADEIFDDHLNNFNRQQQNANRLQKEFNNYIRCIRAAQAASKSLMEAVCEIYEPQWTGYEALQAQVSASESLWQDFSHKLADQVLIPLNTYTGQFPEMKKKVDKRNRKLIDYDSQRHSFQNLQANANKRKDDVKLTKGREQLEEARRTYELMNTELHDELPALYDSRILFLVTNLQTLFATEQVFHSETSKIFSELEAIVDKLATESQRGSNTLRKQTSNILKSTTGPVQTPVKQLNNANITNSNQYQNQITANGTSNNPPSPSSSTLGQRLDHDDSPTPPDTTQSILGELAIAKADSSSPVTPSRTSTPTIKTLAADTIINNSVIENDAAGNLTNDPEKLLSQNVISSSSSSSATIGSTTVSKEANKAADVITVAISTPAATTTNTTTTTTTTANTNTNTNNAGPINELSTTIALKEKSPSSGTKLHKVKNDLNLGNMNSMMATTTATTITTTSTTGTTKVSTAVSVGTTASLGSISSFELNLNGNSNKQTTNGENCLVTTTTINSNNNMTNTANNNTTTTNGSNDTDANAITTTTTTSNTVDDSNRQQLQLDATLTDLPPGVLYRVKATYGYVKEDVDELSFEVGDIIRVIEYDDPEDQEEGWLMGQKEGTEDKGLFPANFTRPI
uniref:Uncharacterized protein n=1 Tax=Glossina brevipalpis TaxID=37001 RepID=A0A1A9WNU7_9MUSC